MARIRSYDLDENISVNDYLLGNDGDNGSIITKRFNVDDLKNFVLEGAGISLVDAVDSGWVVSMNHEGTSAERSPIQVTTIDRTSTPLTLTSSQGTFNLALNGNGNAVVEFVGYTLPYQLNALSGIAVTFSDTNLTEDVTGTFGDLVMNGISPFTYNSDGVSVYSVAVTLDSSIDQTYPNIDTMMLGATPLQHAISIASDVNLLQNLNVGQNLTVTGDTQLGDRVDIGDTENHNADVHIHGLLNFDEEGDGIVFRSESEEDPTQTTFTVDDEGNINIIGIPPEEAEAPNWNFGDNITVNVGEALTSNGITNNGQLTQNGDVDITLGENESVTIVGNDGSSTTINGGTITTLNSDGTTGPKLRQVLANNLTAAELDALDPDVPNQLESVQIDGHSFELPALSAGVAEALPGLNENLEGAPNTELDGTTPRTTFMMGRFFHGIEQADGAVSITDVENIFTDTTDTIFDGIAATTAPAIDVGVFAYQWIADPNSPTADETARRDRFEAYNNDVEGDERVFFVESGYTDAIGSALDASITRVYEVIAYNNFDDIVTFSLLGGGQLNLATGTLNITSPQVIMQGIPSEPFDQNTHDFVTIDTNSELSRSSLSIAASANGARITEEDGTELPASVGVASLEFTGNQDNITRNGGDVTVDISGKYRIVPNITQASDLEVFDPSRTTQALRAWDMVILRPTNGGADQSIDLPVGALGDSIKIVNTSTISADGTTGATTGAWSLNVSPASGQKIMGIVESAMDSDLDLDDPTASFELAYSGDDLGWVIIGIN